MAAATGRQRGITRGQHGGNKRARRRQRGDYMRAHFTTPQHCPPHKRDCQGINDVAGGRRKMSRIFTYGHMRTAECIYASSNKVGVQLGRVHPDLRALIDFSLSLTRVTFASNGRPTLDLSVPHSDTGTVQVETVSTQSRKRPGQHLRDLGLL